MTLLHYVCHYYQSFWQYYQTYFILKGEDYEDKYALLSTPTKPGVGLITKDTGSKTPAEDSSSS